MLLLTVTEWIGAGRSWPADKDRPVATTRQSALATRLPLRDALERLLAHQRAYADRGPMAVEYTLLSVTSIDDVGDDLLRRVNVWTVESLPTAYAEDD